MKVKLTAPFDQVIVKPVSKTDQMQGAIIIPQVGAESNVVGVIEAVGPGKPSMLTGEEIPTRLKVGMKVVLPQMGGMVVRMSVEGEEYYICPETHVMAVLEEVEESN